MQNFKDLYSKEIVPFLKEQFQYKNLHEVPNIKKIQVNRGLGLAGQNKKTLDKTINEFRLITGQQPIVTKADTSIAGFKLREEAPIGVTVTLRDEKMHSFLDRLTNLALPRIRDFQGLDPKKFDKKGNYNFGLKDQLIFPELEYDKIDQLLGFNISFVTTATNKEEGLVLLKKLTLPIR
jgi:large subunit ribosomal protein L5